MRLSVTRSARRLLATAGLVAGLSCGGLPGTAYAASTTGPDYEMPFLCGDTWTGNSRYNHSPSALSIDLNKPDDLGALMVASAPGVVTRTSDLGSRSYGRYIIVDHGGGRTTLYAHLQNIWTTQGQAVDQGTILGRVGNTGASTGPHLHFEERLDGRVTTSYFDRTPFRMGSSLSSRNCGDTSMQGGDWDKDGKDEPAIFRRGQVAQFILRRPGTTPQRIAFGRNTDEPLSGDWNGDGRTDIGVRRPGSKAFVLRATNGTFRSITLGRVRDVGVTGDWDGNGTTEVGLWNPGTRVFTLRAADGSTRKLTYGLLGDRPVTGDWNNDKITDVGVYRPGTGTFYLRTQTRAGVVGRSTVRLGVADELPVTGDWDGNGTTDLGVWSGSAGTYRLRITPAIAGRTATVVTSKMGVRRG